MQSLLPTALRLSCPKSLACVLSIPRFRQPVRAMTTKPDKPAKEVAANAATEIKTVTVDGREFREIQEGLGRILVPFSVKEAEGKSVKDVDEQQKVFYNPIQQFNRDLTVLAIKAYGQDVITRRNLAMEKRLNKPNNKRKRDKTDTDGDRPNKHETSTDDPAVPTEVAANGNNTAEAEPKDEQHGRSDMPSELPDVESALETKGDLQSGNSSRQRSLKPPKFTILDALSASGLRALRYSQELPFVTSVTANDLTADAVEAIKRNAEHNGVSSKVNATQGDARAHMYSLVAEEVTREHKDNPKGFKNGALTPSKKYDVIDLDPYGTAATFFDAAVHAVRDDGGLLCVTCTDSGVWATHGYSEKAFALYGGIPIKGGQFSHEAGLRLVLHALAMTAGRHGLAIEPLLSLSIDYYIRIFVKIHKSPASVKYLAGKTMMVYNCDQGCGAWETQLLLRNRRQTNKSGQGVFYKHTLSMAPTADIHCKHCKTKMHLAGPMYAGPLHDAQFIQNILDDLPNASKDIYGTTPRIEGMLQTALEELSLPLPEEFPSSTKEDELAALDHYPFYFHVSALARSMHSMCPDEESFRSAIRGLGYEMTRSHCKPGSIKTNAPWSVIWHIMREWTRQFHPVKAANIKENSAAYHLLRLGQDKDGETNIADKDDPILGKPIVFDKSLGRDTAAKKGLVRYQVNPRENWGPMSRAGGH